ncbi:MAG TPA: hypothetical protein VNQ76_19070 [Planctomicrobium sp.]|nr:hypothetical protein [Planctomicrobium sp.]
MSAKPVKVKSSAKTAPEPAAPRWWQQPGMWLCGLCALIAVTVAVWLPLSLPDLSQQAEYQFPLEETRLTPPNEWVPETILQQVIQGSDLSENVSLLEPDLCEKVARSWESNPWVKSVKSVQITRERTLQVDVEFRTPVAFVEVPGGLYPIDVEGVLLPPGDFELADTSRLPHIRGVKTLPQGRTGAFWGDPIVVAAAQLTSLLTPEQNLETYWKHFGFKALIAPNVDPATVTPDQLVFEIETVGGNRVLWGKIPGVDDLEPTSSVKLARLQDYVTRFGGLDATSTPQRIDIRMFDGISLHPLMEDSVYR